MACVLDRGTVQRARTRRDDRVEYAITRMDSVRSRAVCAVRVAGRAAALPDGPGRFR